MNLKGFTTRKISLYYDSQKLHLNNLNENCILHDFTLGLATRLINFALNL